MLKAMLIVVGIGGMGGEYTTEIPSMEECLEMRTVIEKQDPAVKTLCIPVADETAKIQEFFWIFMDMVDQIKQNQLEWDNPDDRIQRGEDEPTDSGSIRSTE
tara:strand:- start:546 stop:851 length:306 start_codon:yes stop_codon:yes gene_type:complete